MISSITDSAVHVVTYPYGNGMPIEFKHIFTDWIANYYNGQSIIINASDGENLVQNGMLPFLDHLCYEFNIPKSRVILKTHGLYPGYDEFTYQTTNLGIFRSAAEHFKQSYEQNLFVRSPDAKFVGVLCGLGKIYRLRFLYELDCVFGDDAFLIFRPDRDKLITRYRTYVEHGFDDIIGWLVNKKFEGDQTLTSNYGNWQMVYQTYHEVWGKYEVEIIFETDAYGTGFFTEKTARCLAAGKPFLLLSGQGSLQLLQNYGFHTFFEVIDERYDQFTGHTRIQAMMISLKELYQSPERKSRIDRMYEIAQRNISAYKKYV
jgi:hypothetical protein